MLILYMHVLCPKVKNTYFHIYQNSFVNVNEVLEII
jgi:hypothetical protein